MDKGIMTMAAALNFAIGYITAVAGWATLKTERENAEAALEEIERALQSAEVAYPCRDEDR